MLADLEHLEHELIGQLGFLELAHPLLGLTAEARSTKLANRFVTPESSRHCHRSTGGCPLGARPIGRLSTSPPRGLPGSGSPQVGVLHELRPRLDLV